MTISLPDHSRPTWGWTLITVAALITAAGSAQHPSTWPVFVAASVGAGGGLWVLWRRDVLSTGEILVGAVLLRLAFFPLLPGLSDDMFRYVWDGWLQWEGINPYRYAPSAPELASLQESALYGHLNSADYYSVYPPISQLVFAVGGAASESSWTVSYFVIKAVFVLFELAGLFLLSRLTAARNLLLYAWNPLVLVEVAGQGHTEAAVVPFLVGAVWAVRRQKGGLAGLAIAGAGLVKLYPFVLGPYLIRRFGWRSALPGSVLVIAASLPYAAPYVLPHMKASVDLYAQLFEYNAGFYYLLKETFATATGADWSKQIGPALRVVFLAALPVLYGLDFRRNWSFRFAVLATLGLFFVLSTTVHPWYLVALLPIAVIGEASTGRPSWSWLWLGLVSLGTYLFYTGGPYWLWVVLGWGGAAVWAGLSALRWFSLRRPAVWGLAVRRWLDVRLQTLQRRRASEKADAVLRLLQMDAGEGPALPTSATENQRPCSPPERPQTLQILDLGAGEGYVGEQLQKRLDANVELADVVDLNRTALAHQLYDGCRLPYAAHRFDVTVLYYVLHHAAQPEAVLREALRVTRRRVVVVESVVSGPVQHRVLRSLDRFANRLRSGGVMTAQEEDLSFRRAGEWAMLARDLGARVVRQRREPHPVHPTSSYVLAPPDTGSDSRSDAGSDSGSDADSRALVQSSRTSAEEVVGASRQ